MDRKQQLLSLINAVNFSDLTLDQVSIEPATSVNGAQNTSVTLVGHGVVEGECSVGYNRVALSEVFGSFKPVVSVGRGRTDLASVLDNLNARYGLTLEAEEWDWTFDEPTMLGSLAPKDQGLFYWRPLPVVVRVVYELIDIDSELTVPELSGFQYSTLAP